MSDVIFDKKEHELVVRVVRLPYNVIMVCFSGTASNTDVDYFKSVLEEVREMASTAPRLVFDVSDSAFCYSQCVKALMDFASNPHNRPPLHFKISSKLWQTTSLKAIVSFSPACTIGTGNSVESNVCCKGETTSDEEHFFASSGNGSIVTRIHCAGCNKILFESWEPTTAGTLTNIL